MKKHSWKKIGCLLLAMLMMATMLATGVVAAYQNAVIDPEKPVKLTIHKYEMDPADYSNAIHKGTGTTADESSVPAGAKPLAKVTFTAYPVDKNYTGTEILDGVQPAGTAITDTEGIALFENLAQGRYLIVETDKPAHVTQTTRNFLVDLPMTNPDGDGWNYDVHVYPKNVAVLGAAILTKVGEDGTTGLPGAQFELSYKAKEDGEYAPVEGSPYTTNSDGKIVLNNLLAGYYQMKEIAAPTGYGLTTDVWEFQITNNGSVSDKGVETGTVLTETIKNYATPSDIVKNVTTDGQDLESKKSVGDDVTWIIKPAVPTDIETYKSYVVTDQLDSRLTYVSTTVMAGEEELKVNIDYSLTNDNGNLTITFNEAGLAKLTGKDLTINIVTTLNENVTVGEIKNTATLTYKNAAGSTGTKSDSANAWTGGIKIFKHTIDNTPLAGAEFKVYTSEEDAKAGTHAIRRDGKDLVITSNDEGYAIVEGLGEGDYWFVEIKAPVDENGDPYAMLKGPVKVTLDKDQTIDNYVTKNILNTKLVSLPITGGIGTLIFTFSGIALMGVAVLLYIRSRRKSSAQA
ncbi:MAG: SpaH/EbpB family LPXTG-anchored major pilin [Clostridiales bacterium]|nr:SpaH/EbpB family LPXTG-anchored major pilin [Clostridiales bacterium]